MSHAAPTTISPEKSTTSQDAAKNDPGSRKGISPWWLAAAIPVVGAGAALMLPSGPDAPVTPQPPAATISINPLAADAPLQQLGAAAPEGSWKRGVVTQIWALGQEAPEFPQLTINASDLETGRYSYPGDVVISGIITTPGVEVTANSIRVTEGIDTDHVSLNTRELPAIQDAPEYVTISGLNYRDLLVAFQQVYPRGPIGVDGSISGDGITLDGGTITVGGDAHGDITLMASAGEQARAVIAHEHYDTYQVPYRFDDGIAAGTFSEQERQPIDPGAAPLVTVAGNTGPRVTVEQPAPPELTGTTVASTPDRRP